MGVYYWDHEPWVKQQSFWVTDERGRHWQLWRPYKGCLQFEWHNTGVGGVEVHIRDGIQVSMDRCDPFRLELEAFVTKMSFMFTDPMAIRKITDNHYQINIPWEVAEQIEESMQAK